MISDGPDRLLLVVSLRVHPDAEADLERFESHAARIMPRYGGRLELRLRRELGSSDGPDEIHVVSFPDADAYHRYREDPELVALAGLRAKAISETTIWVGKQPGAGPMLE